MEAAAARVRELVEAHRPESGSDAYPSEVRGEVVRFCQGARRAGWTWGRIGAAVGLPTTTSRRWTVGSGAVREQGTAGSGAAGMVPVEVVVAEAAVVAQERLVLVSPGGYRIEGLSLAAAAQLLGVLG